MWPKAISQLIELAPHISRLLPMADRFFQSKTADVEASRSAMEQMAAGLRGDLGQVTAAHAGLYRQLSEQSDTLAQHSAKLDTLAAAIAANRIAAETAEERSLLLQKRVSLLLIFVGTAIVVLGVVAVLAVLILLRLHR